MSKIKNHHFDDLLEVDDNGMADYQMEHDQQLGKDDGKQIFNTTQHQRIGTHREKGKILLPVLVVGS